MCFPRLFCAATGWLAGWPDSWVVVVRLLGKGAFRIAECNFYNTLSCVVFLLSDCLISLDWRHNQMTVGAVSLLRTINIEILLYLFNPNHWVYDVNRVHSFMAGPHKQASFQTLSTSPSASSPVDCVIGKNWRLLKFVRQFVTFNARATQLSGQ